MPKLRSIGDAPPEPRTLVFDFETKPGAYWYDDTTTTLVCAWALKWLGENRVYSCFMVPDWLRGYANSTLTAGSIWTRQTGMATFRNFWAEADVVVTHNGKRFDVPIVNGALDRLGLEPLPAKTHVDTLVDRVGSRGVPRSLEKLASRYELSDSKLHVDQDTWERAYEFHPPAIATVLERAESDVRLTEELYLESLRRGVLK
jgi:hypothetical protein